MLTQDAYAKLSTLNGNVAIINEYGPTETTITATTNVIQDGDLSIGTPVANTATFVLDQNLKPVPVGAIGELYIAGVGLARGYLNNTKLTEEKFISHPLADSSKLYRTGDLVRYLENGSITYIGRKDFQVKIRGFRIELGEIEAALSTFDGIKQTVVLAQTYGTTNTKHLVGYYVAANELDHDVIKEHLKSKLPEYMVPSKLIHLDQLPLNMLVKSIERHCPIQTLAILLVIKNPAMN